ncbi:MAG: hypothetical protein A3H42_05350 [Deltaproteobacteria bacterium RIFCSPLOWO2_02_FULL_46_8]|nr:MAG: hypothetical protein A3H42_05350 [Deltaproteobacteria bacterium RIFCSPLOWO2_02_FULL_46_8]
MVISFKKINESYYKSIGVDLTILWENLHRSPTERILHHQQMLTLVEEAKKAAKNKTRSHPQ